MLQLIPFGAKLVVLVLGALIVLSPVNVKVTQYRGVVTDQLTKGKQFTGWYGTYKDAHDAAEKLSKRTIGNRGTIDVEGK